jgi:CTP synthase (UTP-ammonia lyase)
MLCYGWSRNRFRFRTHERFLNVTNANNVTTGRIYLCWKERRGRNFGKRSGQ